MKVIPFYQLIIIVPARVVTMLNIDNTVQYIHSLILHRETHNMNYSPLFYRFNTFHIRKQYYFDLNKGEKDLCTCM